MGNPEEILSWVVYKPLGWKAEIGYTVDMERCRASAWDYYAGHYQCSRKPKIVIHGYGFCTQHAKIANERLRRFDINAT
jgi:hypothetical protein